MSTPSLQMTPTAYKEGKLYSVLPTSGVGDFTVSRNSKATRVNQDGFIEEVDENVPRLDYTDGGCPLLLTEPQSTNFITDSEDISDSAWSKVNCSVLQNQIVSPDGNINADKILETAVDSQHRLDISTTISSGVATFSLYAKAAERDSILMRIDQTVSFFDLTNGLTSSQGTTESFIKNVGNGWYRCTAIKPISNANEICRINITESYEVFNDYVGDPTKGVYIWGAQLEELSYATSYIKTEGSTVTRLGDVVTDAGDASTFNSSEGVLYAEIEALTELNSSSSSISIGDGSYFGNSLIIQYRALLNTITFKTFSSSVSTLDNFVIDIDELNKVALKYKANDCAFFINGVKVGINTSFAGFSALDRLNFDRGDGGEKFFSKTKELKVFNEALSDSSLVDTTGFSSFIDMAQQFNYELI